LKIGVISDTHDYLPQVRKVIDVLNGEELELVIHCGDYVSPFVIKEFSKLKTEIIGVFGNNDGDKRTLLSLAEQIGMKIYNQPHVLVVGESKIMIFHGLGPSAQTREIVYSVAEKGIYDFIFYGHIHQRDLRKFGKTIVVNPGEVFGFLSGKPSLAIIDLDEKEVSFREL